MLGSIFSMIPSLVTGAQGLANASKQKDRANELIKESNRVKKTPLRKELEQARRGADMMATQGLASTFTAQKQLDADAANNLKAIQQSSPSGAIASAAIASSLADKNKASQSLLARDAEFRTAGAKSALDTLWNVGEKERELEIEQREMKEGLQRRAMALEDSALKREEAAIGGIFKGATGALTGIGGGLDAGIGASMDFRQEQNEQDPNYKPTAGDAFSKAIGGNLFGGSAGKVSPTQSAFSALSDEDKIAFAKTKIPVVDGADDAYYLRLLKDEGMLKLLEEQYGK